MKTPTCGTIYKNPTFSYASAGSDESQYVNVDAVEIVIDKSYVCKALAQASSNDVKMRSAPVEATVKISMIYTFDITKADAIFDQLLLAKIIKLQPGHDIPKAEDLKGKTYCKYHNSNKHTTNNCVVFHDAIQSWIDNGKLKFPEKTQMLVDANLFPSALVNMVDAHLPRDKEKKKNDDFILMYHVPKHNSRSHLKIDFSSQNEPPSFFSNPVYVELVFDSSSEGSESPIIQCSRCQLKVIRAESKL